MSKPSSIQDTSQQADSVLISLLRDKPAPARLYDAVCASNRVAEQCKNAIRRRHPGLSEVDVKLLFIELNYGREIANQVRNWLMKLDNER